MDMNDVLEIVMNADSCAHRTGIMHAIIIRDGELIVLPASECRDSDLIAETIRPRG